MKSNEVIKVFVGCDPNNCDLEQMMVLDYSIHKHTTAPVEIIWMQLSRDPDSYWYSNPEVNEGWNTTKWVTPFSGFRWAIPDYCDYSGKAIYMDADVVVLSDLAELWVHPIKRKSIVAAKGKKHIRRLCTCVWDCKKAKSYLPDIESLRTDAYSHRKMMDFIKNNPYLVQPFRDTYNCIDGESLPIEKIKILHYSDMGTQFSHKYSIPRLKAEGDKHWFDGEILTHPRQELIDLFDKYYKEALQTGYTIDTYRTNPFGEYPKATQVDHKGNNVTRPKKTKSLWSKLFKR